MCNDSSMELYKLSADTYCTQRIRVRSYVEAVSPEDENLVQKHKKVISMHDPYNYTRRIYS